MLKLAMDNIRRINVQFSSKMVGNQQIRNGIYDLIQKVRIKVCFLAPCKMRLGKASVYYLPFSF